MYRWCQRPTSLCLLGDLVGISICGFFYSSDGLLTSKTNSYLVIYLHWQRQKTLLQYIGAITLLGMTAKGAVQQPTANPGTGHRVKHSRQDDETQYQYRKWNVEQERLQTPEETDARVEKALCVKSVMKKKMKLTKEDLKSQLTDKKKHRWTNYRNINKWIQGPSKIWDCHC